jgi:DNA-binding beta-propeller fold protein YncE
MKKSSLALAIAFIFLCLGQADQCRAAAYAYVSDAAQGRVYRVRLADQKVTDTIEVGGRPVGVAVSPRSDRVYVTNLQSHNISLILPDNSVKEISVGNAPIGVAVSPDEEWVYVANRDDHTLSVIYVPDIDLYINGEKDVPTITIGRAPAGVAVSPDGKWVYVANKDDHNLSVIYVPDIDLYINGIKDVPTINVGRAPIGVTVAPDVDYNHVYAANRDSATISFVNINETDPAASTVVSIGSKGSQPHGIAVTPDNSRVYVANLGNAAGEGNVSFADTEFSDLSGPATLPISELNRTYLFGRFIAGIGAPEAPSDLTGTAMSDSQIDLSWTDNALDESGFTIERKKGADGNYSEIDIIDANHTTFIDLDLDPFTTYGYRIRGYNDQGDSDYTDEIEITTYARLAAPSNLVATGASRSEIDLSWTDNSIGESGFKIEMKKITDEQTDGTDSAGTSTTDSGNSYEEVASVGPNVTSFTVGDLERRTDYSFRVKAYIDNSLAEKRLGSASADTETAYSNEAHADTSEHLCFITTAACDMTGPDVGNALAMACPAFLFFLLTSMACMVARQKSSGLVQRNPTP